MKSNYLSVPEVAQILDLSPSLVASWIADGSLRARPLPGEGGDGVAELSLVHLLLRKGMTVPQGLCCRARLLIVDDEPTMLRSTARLFKRGAPHLELSLAEGAVDGWIQACDRRPDVILVDMYMRGITGVDLCGRIKELPATSGVIVIAFSGRRDVELEHAFKRAGAVALLDKPPNVRQLLDVLESASIDELSS